MLVIGEVDHVRGPLGPVG